MSFVRAIVMDKPGKLKLDSYPNPRITNETAILRVSLCGICGTDKHIYKDEVKSHPFGMPTKFPIIPGHEIVGTIEEISDKAGECMSLSGRRLTKGDRVVPVVDLRCGTCWGCKSFPGWPSCERGETYGWGISSLDPPHLFGGFAEKMYMLPQTKLARVPDTVPDEAAVFAEVLSVGCSSIGRISHSSQVAWGGGPFAGDVLVQGSGPVALAHIIAARVAGANRIIVTGMPEYRLKFMSQFGIDKVIDVRETSKEERIARVMDLFDGHGADVVFECTGDPDVLEEGLSYVKPFGYYLVAGIYADLGRVSTVNVQKNISGKFVTVVGSGGQAENSYAQALRIMENNKSIPFEKIVTHTFGLESYTEAMQKAISEESMKVAFKA